MGREEMPFKKFVEIGRIALLNDGPNSGVLRQEFPIKRLQLTPIAVKFPFNAPTRIVRKELEANKVNETWESSTWSKRMAVKAKRAGLTDLDRFKLRKAKSARNKILAKALNSKKRTLRKAGKLWTLYRPCSLR